MSATARGCRSLVELRSTGDLDAFEWAFLFLTLLLAGIHLYLGLFAASVPAVRATQFVLIGVGLLVGPALFFTPYWQPLLYLLGAMFVLYLGVLWVLGGAEYFEIGVLTGVAATIFVVLALFLFVREEPWFFRT